MACWERLWPSWTTPSHARSEGAWKSSDVRHSSNGSTPYSALGRHAELVPELEGLVREQPLRERLRGQLMLAHRCGSPGRRAPRSIARAGGCWTRSSGSSRTMSSNASREADPNHDPSLESPVVAGVNRPSVAQRRRTSSHTEVQVPPDSVAVIDQQRSRVVGHVPVGRRPVAVAIGHGSVWVANADDGTVSRIHPVSPRSHQDDRNRSPGDRPRRHHRCSSVRQRERRHDLAHRSRR